MARLIYASVIRPVITYGSTVWYSPQDTKTARKGVEKVLDTLQAKSLRSVLGAYRAVHPRILEKESQVLPIGVIIERHIANAVKRRIGSDAGRVITNACARIRSRVVGPRDKRNPNKRTPNEVHTHWLRTILSEDTWKREILRQAPTSNAQPQSLASELHKTAERSWEMRWTAYLNTLPDNRTRPPALAETDRNRTQIYEGINKSMCSLITQIRTEKIGLNAFLADRRVPGYTAQCPCGFRRQTAKHIIRFCPSYAEDREELFRDAGTRDYSWMLASPYGASTAARWLQRRDLLHQFQLGLDDRERNSSRRNPS
jgi:hypothetical protein